MYGQVQHVVYPEWCREGVHRQGRYTRVHLLPTPPSLSCPEYSCSCSREEESGQNVTFVTFVREEESVTFVTFCQLSREETLLDACLLRARESGKSAKVTKVS